MRPPQFWQIGGTGAGGGGEVGLPDFLCSERILGSPRLGWILESDSFLGGGEGVRPPDLIFACAKQATITARKTNAISTLIMFFEWMIVQ